MRLVHFDYTLDCTHMYIANIPENGDLKAYHKGDMIICPRCNYRKHKIIEETKTVSLV